MNVGIIIGVVLLIVILIIIYMTMGKSEKVEVEAEAEEKNEEEQEKVAENRVSTRDASIGIYKDCDCEDAITSSVIESGTDINVSGKGEMQVIGDEQWRCVKGTNIKLTDYVHEFSGVIAGEEVDTTLEIPEHDREPIEIKVGCGTGDDVTTEKIEFKWEVRN